MLYFVIFGMYIFSMYILIVQGLLRLLASLKLTFTTMYVCLEMAIELLSK